MSKSPKVAQRSPAPRRSLEPKGWLRTERRLVPIGESRGTESKITKPATLTDSEMSDLNGRVGDIRCAVELAVQALCGGDDEEASHAIGVLDIALRELKSVEDMLEPLMLQRIRDRQAAEVAHG